MTTTPDSEIPPEPRWRPLGPAERRVLGVLVEKAKTTPAGYPMSVNAIVAGCNQKNNRDPLTAYDDVDVENALRQLEAVGVVKEIDYLGRVPKYKHFAYEWLGVRPVELAVLAELLLRGPQSLGELRGRAARMEPIEDLAALKPVVDGLLERKLMLELTPPGRGQVVSHNLYTQAEREELKARYGRPAGLGEAAARGPGPEAAASARAPGSAESAREDAGAIAELKSAVSDLRAELAQLRERLERLEAHRAAEGE